MPPTFEAEHQYGGMFHNSPFGDEWKGQFGKIRDHFAAHGIACRATEPGYFILSVPHAVSRIALKFLAELCPEDTIVIYDQDSEPIRDFPGCSWE